MCENVEHEDGVAVLVFHLPGNFSVDGGDEGVAGNDFIQKLGKGVLQIVERTFAKNSGKSNGVRDAAFAFLALKFKERMELREMNFRPTLLYF